MSNSPTSARLACAAPATRIMAARVNRSLGLKRIFSNAWLRISMLTTLIPCASSTSLIRIAKLSQIQLYLAICERFSNGITTTASGPGGVARASEDGLMNENPCANAPEHIKANTPNATAILFANPKVADCNTVDLTNIKLRHCGKQTGFFMLQLDVQDVKDLEKYFNSSLFS